MKDDKPHDCQAIFLIVIRSCGDKLAVTIAITSFLDRLVIIHTNQLNAAVITPWSRNGPDKR
jgi:hypothetical protein